jgi:hypothetical protein
MALKEETAPQKAETQVCGQSGGRSEVGLATSAPRSAVVGAVSKRSESDDAYPCILRRRRVRVIQCREDIQWIVQVRYGNRWRNVSYHRDREALIERCRLQGIDQVALAELSKLPMFKP